MLRTMQSSLLYILGCVMLWAATAEAQDPTKLLYWIHDSCANRKHNDKDVNFRGSLAEAMKIAYKTAEYIENREDQYHQNVVAQIMKTQDAKDIEAFRKVFKSIGNDWEETKHRLIADLMFYCDDDVRWSPAFDTNGKQRVTNIGTKEKPEIVRVWRDKENEMVAVDNPSCWKDNPKRQDGVLYYDDFPDKTKNSRRCAITLCENAWSPLLPKQGFPWLIDEMPKLDFSKIITHEDKFPRTQLDSFRYFPSTLILHEMMHFYNQEGQIASGSDRIGDPAYGWTKLIKLAKEKAMDNADSYMYLGILVWLSGRGFSLSRVEDTIPQANEKNAELARKGNLMNLNKMKTP